MNKIIISGNLGREVELRDAGGTPVGDFSVAVRGYKKDEVEWFNVTTWKETAQNCKKYLTKGSKVLVEGRMQTRSYEKNGETIYRTELIANNVEFMDSKPRTEQPQQQAPAVEDIPF